MRVDHTRSEYLTDFGKATLDDRYLLPGETYQDLFVRVAKHYANRTDGLGFIDEDHAQRIYDYMSKLWFMPATPVLSNGGTDRGLPISCFLTEAGDNMADIVASWNENTHLAQKGGGIGTYWGNIRELGAKVGSVGKSSGVVPFLKVQDSLTLAISQGSLRRGSAAIYLPIWHPEIEEFIEIRRPTGGDPNRKCLNLNNGVVIDDKFMEAVEKDLDYALLSPKDGAVVNNVKARDLWIRLLTARIETGEPYLLFLDTVNRERPAVQKMLGLKVKTSNLCSEITLPTGKDQHGEKRTAVCCLSSLNLEKYEEWRDHPDFIRDVMYFLDNVLEDFIRTAPDTHRQARYAAMRERSVGLGVMGLHSYYQARGQAFDSKEARDTNKEIFRHIKIKVDEANAEIAAVRGACPDAEDVGMDDVRFSNTMAIAPTASISIICGGTSPGIEPIPANAYQHKTLSGSFLVKNRYLQALLRDLNMDTQEVWTSIISHEGSVQHLEFLSQEQKNIFKTAFEIDQMSIIEQAADRMPMISQAQSVNLFLPADVSKKVLHTLHFLAWKMGLKSLYYCRSKSLKRAEKSGLQIERKVIHEIEKKPEYEVCEACQ